VSRIQRVAEVLRAALSVGEIRDTFQIAAAAMARRNRPKRPAGFADNVKPRPQFAVAYFVGTRSVHGKVAGISDHARAHFLEVKLAPPRNITSAICPSPSPTLGLSQAGMSDGCSTAKERDDDAKAMTMIKRLTILTSRRTELDRTGSILPIKFCNCLRRCRDEGTFAARPLIAQSDSTKSLQQP
jgi:hypothetical protein